MVPPAPTRRLLGVQSLAHFIPFSMQSAARKLNLSLLTFSIRRGASNVAERLRVQGKVCQVPFNLP